MAIRTINGRRALDRRGVAAHLQVAYTTVTHWRRHRTRFGFPEGFHHDGTEYFWLDEIKAFHGAHLTAKRAELTTIDRSGHPDDLVGSGEAARILRYASYRNLPDTLLDRPDRTEDLPDGRIRRFWFRRTVWAIADARTGRQSTGRTPGTTGPRKPHAYADDPRLKAAAALLAEAANAGRNRRGLGPELARRLGIGERTAQRLLTAATSYRSQSIARTGPALTILRRAEPDVGHFRPPDKTVPYECVQGRAPEAETPPQPYEYPL